MLPKFSTLVDILRERAQEQQDQKAYTFLKDGETELSSLTYGKLDRLSKAIAAHLQTIGATGQRALLLYPPGLEFIAAFFGCLYAGVVAVPAYPPRLNQKMSRLEAIVSDAQATVALTTTSLLANIESRFAENPELAALLAFTTDNIASDLASDWQEPAVSSDTLAFLQYTSGSTGTPKGVMVTHSNLLHNSEYIKQAFELTPDSVSVTWLPSFHDMGLIDGIIQPIYTRFPAVLMPPASFIQRPMRWLQAISRYKATHCGGPNFGYELCVSKITPEQRETLDLSSWCSAYSGAEPIRRQTLERFSATFKPYGFRASFFYPCYGMAETTLMVSGGNVKDEPVYFTVSADALEQNRVVEASAETENVRQLVGCGREWLETKIVIADPESLTQCVPDQVGEIWVSGSSVAQGYWNRPEQTEQTFRAYLADTGEGPFLRTGDLGFLLDGELFVTGRLKDVIIIRGRNHYPQDIELTVEQSHPALRPNSGAAFSVEFDGREQLAIAQEVERSYLRKLNANEVIGAIRRAVAEQHDLQVYAVLLLKTASLPKTSSGKIQRSACRTQFQAGSLDVVADWSVNPQNQTKFRLLKAEVESLLQQVQTGKLQGALSESNNSDRQARSQQFSHSQEAIEAWLISKVSEQLASSEEIDIRQPLATYGLSSLAAVSLSGELQEWLCSELSPTLLYDYPTIEVLAQHLAVEPADDYSSLKVDVGRKTETEAIAIIGIGCRFPGAKDPEAFWKLLRDGVDTIQEVPPERWNVNAFYDDQTPAKPGKMNTRWGGFLEQVDQFDPQFFGISPREAESMDPQQRLLLEVSWEALENAGQVPEQLAGSQTGVFIGISNYDYSQLQLNNPAGTDAHYGTGNAFSIAANRLSYLLDLRGPSWAVDTACSSSLVAVHQACQSLGQQECHLALAGGVNLILTPQLTITFSQAGMMAADGRCKTFDADADGYVRGEGCGVVVLKRLSDALRDGDNILALIKGSAVSQDGRSNGLTAPNGLAQQTVIHQALENAKVQPAQINYLEAHGTGTSLGDPIELNALKAVLMQGRSSEQPCWIGSVKTNIGHLEAAAGIAGLIKVVLSLQHEEIPPHLHLQKLNPYIPIEGTPLSIPTEDPKWFGGRGERLAGVSSFGFGGTNAHVILESAPTPVPVATEFERAVHLLTVSAKSEKALRELAQGYAAYLQSHPEASVADVCYTANIGRSHFDHRLAVIAESTVQLQEQLDAFAANRETLGLVSGQAHSRKRQKIAFLFTGQGSQYVGMGRQLYEQAPTFRQTLDRCDEILRPYLEKPLLSVLYPATGESSPLDETAYTQPALFALEYALFQLWKSWGIEPAVVMGHSVGEYVAATVAGVFSLEDGLKLIASRGHLMQALPQDGEMVAVLADYARVQAAIQPYAQEVAIAAINGPESMVISGQRQAVKAAIAALEAEGIQTKPLQVSHAFHSPLMEPMLAAFEQVATTVTYSVPRISLISNVTGELVTQEVTTPQYWCRHLRQPVRFAASMETLQQQGYEVFVEIGPKPTLLGMARHCLPQEGRLWLPSLRSGSEDWQQLLQSLGELYVRGVPVDWSGFDRDYPRRRVALPTYPFQRQRYWIETTQGQQKAGFLSQEKVQTPIINLLNQGDSEQLAQLLAHAGNFSQEKMKILPEVLEVLVKQHQQQLQAASIKDWLYSVEWQALPRQKTALERTQALEPGSWLILADPGGVGQALAKLLLERGQNCILVYAGDAYQKKETGTWSINPSNLGDFERLFLEANGTSVLPLTGIIHLWSLEAAVPEELTIPTLEQAQKLGCGSVLHLVQTLVKHNGSASRGHLRAGVPPLSQSVRPQLWLVTRGAMPIGHSLPKVAQAPLWGLGKAIALEHPEIWGGMLDLAPEATKDEVESLLAEIWQKDGEDHLAWREGQRYVARLVPSSPPKPQRVQLRPDGTYLITGGLGVLGLKVATWMVEKGARHLVLTGRSSASAQAQETLSQLEQAGAKVFVAKADVSNAGDMLGVLEAVKASMPPLQGIIHAAGVLDDGILLQQNWERFSRVMAPKVKGAWNLHILTQELPLDFFVLFSSAASLLGSPGQGNYAAANTFMDLLAHYRRALGKPGLSINWGPWDDAGMAANSNYQVRLAARGMSSLKPEQGLKVLEQLLGQTNSQVGVLPIEWSEFSQQLSFGRQLPLLSKLIHEVESQEEPEQISAQRHEFLQQLKSAQASDRLSLLTAHIQGVVAKVLKLAPSQLPDPKQNFFDMGMDSLMVVELKNNLQSNLGQFFPTTLVFNYPNINALVQYLSQEVLSLDISAQASQDLLESQDELTTSLEEIKQLSESEVMDLIAQEFEAYR